jgi:hypothetical protein
MAGICTVLLSAFFLLLVLIGREGVLKLADFGWAIHDPNPK